MNGSSCSGGAVLAVIAAAPVAEALCTARPDDARAPRPGERDAGQPVTGSSRPCSRTASSPRTL